MSTGYELQRFERLENCFYEYASDDQARLLFVRDLVVLLRDFKKEQQNCVSWADELLQKFS